jgi:amino acid transporter
MILRDKFPELERKFKLPCPNLFGYLGFAACSFFVYWSGTDNLFYLVLLILLCCGAYWLIFERAHPLLAFKKSWYFTAYVIGLFLISYYHKEHLINFPIDNYLVFGLSIIFTKIFLINQDTREGIAINIEKLKAELQGEK